MQRLFPKAAADASVRATLLKGSCSVKLQPLVWQCVLKANDLASVGLNCFTNFSPDHSPARILAISIKWFIPIAQKKKGVERTHRFSFLLIIRSNVF
jgi:hypothetical protein